MSGPCGFIVLAHEKPKLLWNLLSFLAAQNCPVLLHVDQKLGQAETGFITRMIRESNTNFLQLDSRDCQWGSYDLVAVMLAALRRFRELYPDVVHIQLMSGVDFFIKPYSAYVQFLSERRGTTFIDIHDASAGQWVVHGMAADRLTLYHLFNHRRHPRLTHLSWRLQKSLRIDRKLPLGMTPKVGSQWINFCSDHVDQMLDLVASEPKLEAFFKWTMVPDESFFHTVLSYMAYWNDEIRLQSALTLCDFYENGAARVFYDSHYDELLASDRFLARKISDRAIRLYNLRSDDGVRGASPPRRRPASKRTSTMSSARPEFDPKLISVAGSDWYWLFNDVKKSLVLYCSTNPAKLESEWRTACRGSWLGIIDENWEFAGHCEGFRRFGLPEKGGTIFRKETVEVLRNIMSTSREDVALGLSIGVLESLLHIVRAVPTAMVVISQYRLTGATLSRLERALLQSSIPYRISER